MSESIEHTSHARRVDEITFADLMRFLGRYWLMIACFAMGFAIAAAVGILVVVSEIYEASATLVVVPPAISSEFKPQTLTVQGYQQLLESDAVIADAKKRLVEEGSIQSGTTLRIGKNIDSRIFVSRRAEERELAPIIIALARAHNPETAAAIANTWCELFLDRSRDLTVGTTTAAVQFVDREFPRARDTLMGLEDELVATENRYQKRHDNAATAWDRETTLLQRETSEMVAGYLAATKNILETYSGEKNIETRSFRRDALHRAYGDLQDEQARVTSSVQLKQLQLEAARKQIEITPQFVTVRKTITDEALWNLISERSNKETDWEGLGNLSLASQEINSVFEDLSMRKNLIEIEVNALVPRSEALELRLEDLSSQIKTLDVALRSDMVEFERLNQERSAGLAVLKADRELRLSIMNRQRDQELGMIIREQDTRVAQAERDIEQETELFLQLASDYNEATLTKAERNVEDVRLAAPAVPPERPRNRGAMLYALLAGLLGGFVGIFVAILREAVAHGATS